MIDVSRTLPVISAAESPDETAPLKAFSEENALVVRSFNDMLDQIADRTMELSRTNTELQHEVDERKRVERATRSS